MVRIAVPFTLAFLLSIHPCLAQEHEHEVEELGHHWAAPAYAAEIHLQMYVIFGGLILLHLTKLVIARLRRGAE